MSDTTTDPTTQFSAEAVNALGRLLVILADNKYRLGLRYAEWCNSAPTLEAAVAAAAMTQDELGHARSLYPLLRDFPEPPAEFKEDEAEREAFLHMGCLERSFETWADFVAANSVPDQMLGVVFEAATASTYAPLSQRAAKIRQEEHFHDLYAQGWCAQFGGDETARQQLQAAVGHLWAESLAWFGPQNDADLALLHAEGILEVSRDALRQRFVDRVEGLLTKEGVELPDVSTDWDSWDSTARRMASA